ncbi:uncharacterized protein TRIVIDRAFT_203391 [Trichoderma virens Gv29-8]|uniref:DUF4220 domain-containing protein n=1 Tax=Hypocrea virens (strain Gv29-8 / FGSC 10586) TaxID=413071 RepID=G9N0C9_HYPVG|nr:uncharacterized protein TRIVIDRAFT_203391 [Trichoderma virens Gv29-8]EHK19811.1 hypothetical protein TRIVIDRAFT_203391 [Trichoderma virens Gv29-8]
MIKGSLWLAASLPMLAAARNCTVRPISDNETVGWQPGGCYRGTWNIISTCLSTIIACTWSIQHLNIPATDDTQFQKNKRKMKWMIITVLFPELVLIHAIFEFHMAWKALRLMSDKEKPVKWPWWFRNPPLSWLPYCRRYLKDKNLDDQEAKNLESQDAKDQPKKEKWTLAHCYFANMGGFMYIKGKERLPVTAQQLAEDDSYLCLEITEEDIKDKSKQDWLAKLFAALQILQLILSIITRHIQGVHFSQLETVTLSFAICGVLIYCTYFYKPQNIERAIELKNDMRDSNVVSQYTADDAQEPAVRDSDDVPQNRADDTQKAAARFFSLQSEKPYDSFWAIMLNKQTSLKKPDSKGQKTLRIPNDNIPIYKGSNEVHPAVYLLALASGLFGAIHAIAWQFEFPTEEEKLLWQICTCISAASPVVGLLVIPFAQFTKASGDPELFAGNCLRLMQEYSWHTSNMSHASNSINELEAALANGKSKKYSEIFPLDETGESPFELHDDKPFVENFHRLVSAVNGRQTKKIDEAARTDAWPIKPLLPRGVNQGVLIRKMPGSVYIATNWTEYLPAFGAMAARSRRTIAIEQKLFHHMESNLLQF